jgi:hypothetical protein
MITIKLKYVISIILLYIYIVSICIGYVIKENEIVKNDIKCLFEERTTWAEQQIVCVLKNDLPQKMNHTDHKKS